MRTNGHRRPTLPLQEREHEQACFEMKEPTVHLLKGLIEPKVGPQKNAWTRAPAVSVREGNFVVVQERVGGCRVGGTDVVVGE